VIELALIVAASTLAVGLAAGLSLRLLPIYQRTQVLPQRGTGVGRTVPSRPGGANGDDEPG
jgi:hypothetical protein